MSLGMRYEIVTFSHCLMCTIICTQNKSNHTLTRDWCSLDQHTNQDSIHPFSQAVCSWAETLRKRCSIHQERDNSCVSSYSNSLPLSGMRTFERLAFQTIQFLKKLCATHSPTLFSTAYTKQHLMIKSIIVIAYRLPLFVPPGQAAYTTYHVRCTNCYRLQQRHSFRSRIINKTACSSTYSRFSFVFETTLSGPKWNRNL